MVASFSASGFFVQTPFGPRKSGIPDSVEMPAPVSTTVRFDEASQEDTTARSPDIAQVYLGGTKKQRGGKPGSPPRRTYRLRRAKSVHRLRYTSTVSGPPCAGSATRLKVPTKS